MTTAEVIEQRIADAVFSLDAWFDTMRCAEGYGGPVAHWWRDCLSYAGAGLDWRYEGIICGYLSLFERTGNTSWLDKARRAGNDLVRGQLSNGNFENSSFEFNPLPGGTPHEAACDLALLKLAMTLRDQNDPNWHTYADSAARNLQSFILGSLWSGSREAPLRNLVNDAAFVPNKASTTVEALLAWVELGGPTDAIEHYVVPMLDAIVSCQIQTTDATLSGAIRQSTSLELYFPLYVARCIPGLVQGATVTGDSRYLRAAEAAVTFILRHQYPDGSFSQVIRRSGRIERYPRWIAGVGDVLRAMDVVGLSDDDPCVQKALGWLLSGTQPTGGIACATGFTTSRFVLVRSPIPDWRDLLPICGWADKAFRYLAGRAPMATLGVPIELHDTKMTCRFRGRTATYLETSDRIEVRGKRDVVYRWRKGALLGEMLV